MFKPVMPYVTDIIAHIFFFKDHMLTVHAHNGKYHVHAEVAEAAKNQQQDKNTDTIKKGMFGAEHIFTETYKSFSSNTSINWCVLLPVPIKKAFVSHHFPPPRI